MTIGSFFRKSVIAESPRGIGHRYTLCAYLADKPGGHLYFLEDGAALTIQVFAFAPC